MATRHRVSRRTFLRAAGAAAGVAAGVGQSMRRGAQRAVDNVNAAGGIKSMGGAKIALVLADTQTKPDVAVSETQRVINEGAVAITGPFHSGHAMAMVPIVQQRRVPLLIDIAAADVITLNVAKSVKEGQQKVQYVYRLFPTTTLFGHRAVIFMNEIFK